MPNGGTVQPEPSSTHSSCFDEAPGQTNVDKSLAYVLYAQASGQFDPGVSVHHGASTFYGGVGGPRYTTSSKGLSLFLPEETVNALRSPVPRQRSSPRLLPRRNTLLGILASGVFLFFFLKVYVTCGSFMCMHRTAGRHADRTELAIDMFPQQHAFAEKHAGNVVAPAPMHIPRIIHQTYATSALPPGITRNLSDSWKVMNGEAWEERFYDDEACLKLVKTEFPEYLDAYKLLRFDVERSDFFRYMVILKYGGVYADVDVECRKPLEEVILPTDTMVVGWEVEVPTQEMAFAKDFIRLRQVLQWFFAAAPGHPVLREVCDSIAANVHTIYSLDPNRDTLERTGPGIWTDAVLRFATQHPLSPSQQWSVRILPRVAFGVAPGDPAMPASSPQVAVMHHFLGSWKNVESWRDCSNWACRWQWAVGRVKRVGYSPPPVKVPQEQLRGSGVDLFPVSVDFNPSFAMMVDLIGHGDMQSGSDVGAAITDWGTWQAALSPARSPSVVEALVGSLGSRATRATLVDVGAAQGLFSLAAAARGHRALSFELSDRSVAAFQASIAYNGFDALVDLREVALGAETGEICIRRRGEHALTDAANVNLRRGYGDPAVHALRGPACDAMAQRQTLSGLLGNDGSVGALRLSANGWEGWILDGAVEWLQQHPPGLVHVEFAPALMARAAYEQPTRMLEQLYALGYSSIAHSGHVCDERWGNLTRDNGSPGSSQQATWCKLKPESFHLLVDHAHGDLPENVLFVHDTHPSIANAKPIAAAATTTALLGSTESKARRLL